MIESRIARKYATALFRTAKRINQMERIFQDLELISDLLVKNPLLKSFLESPQISDQEKRQLISTTFKDKISEALLSFLMLVVNKKRIQYLLSMGDEFRGLVKFDQGIVQARLITARKQEQTLLEEIRQEMEKNTGKKVEMEIEVNPHLIGGVVIILGDRIIDKSIRNQLSQLREQMTSLRVY